MTDAAITKSIKQLATELYYAAKAEGHEIKTIEFDEVGLMIGGESISLIVRIESTLCEPKKAP